MIIDLSIILIIALFTFIGYKKGLVKMAIRILAFFIAIIISFVLYKTVGNMIIKNTNIDETIENAISSKVFGENYEEKTKNLPDALVETGNDKIEDTVATITEKTIYVVTFILLFVASKIALRIVTLITDVITKLPIIKQFDKAGGLIFGFAKGAVVIIAIFAIISVASPMIDEKYIDEINKGILASELYNNNLLLKIIK